MSKSQSVETTWTDDDTDIEYRISATVESYSAARFSGHPDSWCPAEGGGVEDLTATDESGRRYSFSEMEILLGEQKLAALIEYVEEEAAEARDSWYDDRDDDDDRDYADRDFD